MVLVVMLMPNIAIMTIVGLGGDHVQQLGRGVLSVRRRKPGGCAQARKG
jgi:hypothetical protein